MAKKAYFWSFLLLTAIYVGLSVGLPTNPKVLEQYGISQAHARLLGASIALPIAAVYLSALYGFVRFKSYSASIKATNEGRGFKLLSDGLTILAFGLPISSITSVLLSHASYNYPDMLPAMTIIRNYVALIFPFIAFLLIALGSENLLSSLKRKIVITRQIPGMFGVVALASIFTWIVAARPSTGQEANPYYLPNWLLIATLVIPYVYVWCRGIHAAHLLYVYKDAVRGTLYKRSLNYLAKGVAAIISFSIAGQIITAMSVRLNRLDLTPLLLLVYALIVLYAVGFAWVARGAKKLKQIEEV